GHIRGSSRSRVSQHLYLHAKLLRCFANQNEREWPRACHCHRGGQSNLDQLQSRGKRQPNIESIKRSIMLQILYQDDDIIAVNKPHGMLVHRSPIAADVEVFALQTLKEQLGQMVYPAHRIDRKTGGV